MNEYVNQPRTVAQTLQLGRKRLGLSQWALAQKMTRVLETRPYLPKRMSRSAIAMTEIGTDAISALTWEYIRDHADEGLSQLAVEILAVKSEVTESGDGQANREEAPRPAS